MIPGNRSWEQGKWNRQKEKRKENLYEDESLLIWSPHRRVMLNLASTLKESSRMYLRIICPGGQWRQNLFTGYWPHCSSIKIYWAWPHPSEQDPVSPSVSLSHQEAFITFLSFSSRGQTDWKPQSQKTNQSNHNGPQPCLTQWNYEPCHVGPPKTDESWWRVLTKHGPLEKGMNGKPLQYSCLENPKNSMKRQKEHWKRNSPGL